MKDDLFIRTHLMPDDYPVDARIMTGTAIQKEWNGEHEKDKEDQVILETTS
jgi:hypothetical protein